MSLDWDDPELVALRAEADADRAACAADPDPMSLLHRLASTRAADRVARKRVIWARLLRESP